MASIARSSMTRSLSARFKIKGHRHYTKFSKDTHAPFDLDGATEAIHISSLTSQGHLVLSNGRHITRSAVLFPNFALDWKVNLNDVENVDAYILAQVLKPKPEIVLVGTGHQSLFALPSIRAYFSSLKIPCEIMDTHHACSTFNLLVADGKYVLAFLMKLDHL